jgi:predicted pyridoxine 5'-phosphate oxidase superfamily flavin-nucleotide-binding protein
VSSHFLQLAATPAVRAAQERHNGEAQSFASTGPDLLGGVECEFIAARDSFYLASVTEAGWPYVQHRGGPAGFLRVLGPNVIGFADLPGNRQMLSVGNLAANDRVALFLMDYPQRSRLKILGHARVCAAKDDPGLAARLNVAGPPAAERLVRIEVVAFDWNCPKYITPRYTRAEVDAFAAPLRERIAELESELRARR